MGMDWVSLSTSRKPLQPDANPTAIVLKKGTAPFHRRPRLLRGSEILLKSGSAKNLEMKPAVRRSVLVLSIIFFLRVRLRPEHAVDVCGLGSYRFVEAWPFFRLHRCVPSRNAKITGSL